jgi:hypothetical protein
VVAGALLLFVACGGRARSEPPPATPQPDDRSTARPGDPPPRYAPSGLSDDELPITSNAYGAFTGAPAAPGLGDTAPDFEAALVDGGTFRLAQARAAGPVLVMFYRGFW